MLKKVLNSENIIDTCTTNRIAIYMLSTVGDKKKVLVGDFNATINS